MYDSITWHDIQMQEDDRYGESTGWVPGVDFDPSDPDEMATMDLVWEREWYDETARLRRENAQLRAALARATGEAEG